MWTTRRRKKTRVDSAQAGFCHWFLSDPQLSWLPALPCYNTCVLVSKRPQVELITSENALEPPTVRPLTRDPRVPIGWPFPLGLGLDGRLLLARRGWVHV